MVTNIPLAQLRPHPNNPRIEPRTDIVEQLAARMADGFDPSHALIVRPIHEGHQIISGHHRAKAAERAGLSEVPCWVRDLSDDEAYMQLVLCNTQSELHALEEGKHAAESGLDLKAYAERSGKNGRTLHDKVKAWRVLANVHVHIEAARNSWRNLAEIHAAPEWLWSALVERMLAASWTVAVTRQMVATFKECEPPPPWANAEEIGQRLTIGHMQPNELQRLGKVLDTCARLDEDLLDEVNRDLFNTRPARLSEAQSVINNWLTEQDKRENERRSADLERQRAQEEAAAKIARLRDNISLTEWNALDLDTRNALINSQPNSAKSFNAQESADIEWAQWSWNPVTGCKHDCPYCYARDIALSKRMEKVYPNGWEPSFRNAALSAPQCTKIPKQAQTDTRYRNVFTCSMADLFGRWVPIEWINCVMSAVRQAPQWNFLFLTKFPQRLGEIEIPDNAWMGTTVDMQARVANAERAFETVTSKVKWLSVEPMIEPIVLTRPDLFDWVVIGGASRSEQTPEWRPPYRWIEQLVRQCDDAGIPVYMKSNLGIANRVLQLPFDAPLSQDPQSAPNEFHYLGHQKKAA